MKLFANRHHLSTATDVVCAHFPNYVVSYIRSTLGTWVNVTAVLIPEKFSSTLMLEIFGKKYLILDISNNYQVLSRDMCFFLQDGLKTPIPSRFENLLHQSQKSRYLQRKIKPFEVRNAGFYTNPGSMPY